MGLESTARTVESAPVVTVPKSVTLAASDQSQRAVSSFWLLPSGSPFLTSLLANIILLEVTGLCDCLSLRTTL